MRPAIILIALILVAASTNAAQRAAPLTKPSPDQADYSCRIDADCAVRNVGNCCGYYPACINRESPTFPERIKAECVEKGLTSVCGFPEIKGCACVEGRCADVYEGRTIR